MSRTLPGLVPNASRNWCLNCLQAMLRPSVGSDFELASRSGGADVATEIRKRLVTIAKARSFVDWRKIKALALDLETQRIAITTYVAPDAPAEAFDLLWRILAMAPSIYERSDDGNGMISNVIAIARADLGAIGERANSCTLDTGGPVFENCRK